MWCPLAVGSVYSRYSALNTPPDVALYADPSHDCASHYTSSLFYMPGSLAFTYGFC